MGPNVSTAEYALYKLSPLFDKEKQKPLTGAIDMEEIKKLRI
jgi:hypothetical protein